MLKIITIINNAYNHRVGATITYITIKTIGSLKNVTLSISFCFLYDVRMHLFVLFFCDCCTIGEFYPYIFITHTKKGRTHYIMSQNLPQNSLLRVTKYYSYFLHTYMIKATILKPSNTSWIMIKFAK